MLPRMGSVVVCALLAGAAGAVSVPEVWQATGEYRLDYPNLRVYLRSAGDFWIQSKDAEQLGDINLISIDPQVPPIQGVVRIFVVRDPAEVGGLQHEPGALHVKQIDLSRATEGDIVELRVTGTLAAVGPISAWNIGDCIVGNPEDPDTGAILNAINLTCLDGTYLECNSMADLTVSGGCGTPRLTPRIIIHGNYSGLMDIDASGAIAEFRVDGYVTNKVLFSGGVEDAWIVGLGANATLEIGGFVTDLVIADGIEESAVLTVGGDLENLTTHIVEADADIRVGGDVLGQFWVTLCVEENAVVEIAGSLEGSVLISPTSFGCGPDGAQYGLRGSISVGEHVNGYLGIGSAILGVVNVGLDLNGLMEAADRNMAGEIVIGRDLVGELNVRRYDAAGEVDLSGAVRIGQDLLGTLRVSDGDLDGLVEVKRHFVGHVNVGYSQAPQNMTGALSVTGDWVGGGVEVYGNLSDPNNAGTGGRIMIDGGFGETGYGSITIHGQMAPGRPAITVDFDGYQVKDSWGPYGHVWVNGQEYTGNSPLRRIYRVTGCKGDGNNNGMVDITDLAAMLAAIQGPVPYAARYPGLEGSMVFHCDLTGPITNECDGLVNWLDFDFLPFRFGTCSTACGVIDGGDGPSATELATALHQNVPNGLRAVLLDVLTDLRLNHPAADRRAYWQAVHERFQE